MAKLTSQEQAVARLVASGVTNQQAALELLISVKTVKYHLTHIYSKPASVLAVNSPCDASGCRRLSDW